MDDADRSPSRAQQAADLHKALDDAHQLVQEAHANYMKALSIGVDTDPELSSDGALAVQQRGQEYAGAVIRYSEAVMAFLSHMEISREKARKLTRKAKSGE